MDENLRHRCSRVEGAKPRLAERVEAAIALSGPACRATQEFLRTLDALNLVELANAGTRITESFPETLIFLDKHDLLDLAEHALAQLAHEGFTTRLLGYHGKSPEEIVWNCLTKHQALGCARLVQEKLYPLKAGIRTGLPAEILCQAALRANEAMLRFLVEEVGVHPDGRESSAPGVSAVQRLLGEGHEKLGLWLASKPGTNLLRADGQGKDTLMYAAKSCGEEAGRFLLDRGLRPAVSDLTGRTALHEAAAGGNLAMARLLLEAGADPNRADGRGLTPLHLAADGMDKNNMDMVELLARHGADIEARNFMGNTPFLEMAASFWSGKKSEADLEQAVNRWRLLGADLAARNWSGRDAVLLAYGMDGQGLLGRVLLSAGLRPPERLFDGTATVRTVQRSRTFAQDLAAATRRERARQGLILGLEDDEPGPLL